MEVGHGGNRTSDTAQHRCLTQLGIWVGRAEDRPKELTTKGNRKQHDAIPRSVGRVGRVTRQPVLWALATAGMAATGKRGRRAALRGTGCYLVGAAAGNLPKPLFGRAQPRHRWARKPQVIRGSFPSGHACAEVAFVFGAAQEAPLAFVPFGTMAMLAHLSLTRDGKHYVTDTLAGGTIGVLIAAYAGRRWPTDVTRRIRLNRQTKAV